MMMKNVIFAMALGLLSSASSFAAIPVVSCDLIYSKEGSNGTEDLRHGTPITVDEEGATTSNSGFQLEAKLEGIRPAGWGRSDRVLGYKLNLIVSKGISKSVSTFSVSKKKNDRVSTGLIVGTQSGHVNCDIGQ